MLHWLPTKASPKLTLKKANTEKHALKPNQSILSWKNREAWGAVSRASAATSVAQHHHLVSTSWSGHVRYPSQEKRMCTSIYASTKFILPKTQTSQCLLPVHIRVTKPYCMRLWCWLAYPISYSIPRWMKIIMNISSRYLLTRTRYPASPEHLRPR